MQEGATNEEGARPVARRGTGATGRAHRRHGRPRPRRAKGRAGEEVPEEPNNQIFEEGCFRATEHNATLSDAGQGQRATGA